MTATATLMALQPLLPPPPPPLMSTLCSQRSPTDVQKQNPLTVWEIISQSHVIKTVIHSIINIATVTLNISRNEDSLQNFLRLTHSWHTEDFNQACTSWGQQISCLYLPTLSILGGKKNSIHNFHIRIMHRDIIKVFYSPINAQVIVLKTILKFTLKQLRHISVQSHHPQGVHYLCLLKLQLLK